MKSGMTHQVYQEQKTDQNKIREGGVEGGFRALYIPLVLCCFGKFGAVWRARVQKTPADRGALIAEPMERRLQPAA